jgi:hypothetical protein
MTTFGSVGGTVILHKVTCTKVTSDTSFVNVNKTGKAILQDCVFTNENISDIIVFLENSTATITNCSFTTMYRTASGVGAIMSPYGGCNITITSSNFTNMGGEGSSGIARVSGNDSTTTNFTVTNCIFTTCTGKSYAGAFRIINCKNVVINSTKFVGCNTPKSGGALLVETSLTLAINNVTFDKCVATANGGAIYFTVSQVSFTCTQTTFSSCLCTGNGGGINFAKGSPFSITNSTFRNCTSNKAGGYGGGIYVAAAAGATRILTSIIFDKNVVCIIFFLIFFEVECLYFLICFVSFFPIYLFIYLFIYLGAFW